MDGYEALAQAIIVQAAKDYKRELETLKKVPDAKHAKKKIEELDKFFNSEWFKFLTQASGNYIARRIKGGK